MQVLQHGFDAASANLKEAATNLQLPSYKGQIVKHTRIESLRVLSTYAQLLKVKGKLRYERNRLKEYIRTTERWYGKENRLIIPILFRLGYNSALRGYERSVKGYFEDAIELADKHAEELELAPRGARLHLYGFLKRTGKTEAAAKTLEQVDRDLTQSQIDNELDGLIRAL